MAVSTPYRAKDFRIYMCTHAQLYYLTIRQELLNTVAERTPFQPESITVGDEPLLPYSLDEALCTSPNRPANVALRLQRTLHPAYRMFIGLARQPWCELRFTDLSQCEEGDFQAFLEVADQWAQLLRPIMGFVHLSVADQDDGSEHYWDYRVVSTGAGYEAMSGVGGLALRTYIGSGAITVIGRDRLASLSPGSVVTDCEWGGCRVDLHPDLWRASEVDLLARWQHSQTALEPSGFFARLVRSERDLWHWRPGASRELYRF